MNKKLDKNAIVIGVLVILILFTIIQAFQLNGIKSDIKNSDIGGTSKAGVSSTASKSGSSSSGGVPTNLQNLPGMVGGC